MLGLVGGQRARDRAVEIGHEPVDGRCDLDPQALPSGVDEAVGRRPPAVGDPDDRLRAPEVAVRIGAGPGGGAAGGVDVGQLVAEGVA